MAGWCLDSQLGVSFLGAMACPSCVLASTVYWVWDRAIPYRVCEVRSTFMLDLLSRACASNPSFIGLDLAVCMSGISVIILKKQNNYICRRLDELLGGGLVAGEVTEVVGPITVGKSQASCDPHTTRAKWWPE